MTDIFGRQYSRRTWRGDNGGGPSSPGGGRGRSAADEFAEDVEERPALGRELRFELDSAVALAAGPRLGAVLVAAAAAGVGVLHLDQLEILLPVRPLLLQRRRAEAH